jgi:hypothetical protein
MAIGSGQGLPALSLPGIFRPIPATPPDDLEAEHQPGTANADIGAARRLFPRSR